MEKKKEKNKNAVNKRGATSLYWTFLYSACVLECLQSVCYPGNTPYFTDKLLSEGKCNIDGV